VSRLKSTVLRWTSNAAAQGTGSLPVPFPPPQLSSPYPPVPTCSQWTAPSQAISLRKHLARVPTSNLSLAVNHWKSDNRSTRNGKHQEGPPTLRSSKPSSCQMARSSSMSGCE
jgi:hypothetical protein